VGLPVILGDSVMASSPKPRQIDRRKRRWCVMDMVTDPVSGKLRETLVFSVLGKTSALCCFIYEVAQGHDSEWLWLIVMGVLTCHAAFSQFIVSKAGGVTK
jgi:hypothetical protein